MAFKRRSIFIQKGGYRTTYVGIMIAYFQQHGTMTGIQWFTANPVIETYDCSVVAVAIGLWFLKEFKHKF